MPIYQVECARWGDKGNEMRALPLMSEIGIFGNWLGEVGLWFRNFINILLVKLGVEWSEC